MYLPSLFLILLEPLPAFNSLLIQLSSCFSLFLLLLLLIFGTNLLPLENHQKKFIHTGHHEKVLLGYQQRTDKYFRVP